MAQQNYFQICIQQNFRSLNKIVLFVHEITSSIALLSYCFCSNDYFWDLYWFHIYWCLSWLLMKFYIIISYLAIF